MKTKANSHFSKRSRTPVYTCIECGKRTRETGNGESDSDLCARCMYFAEIQNGIYDGLYTEAEAETVRAEYDKNHPH